MTIPVNARKPLVYVAGPISREPLAAVRTSLPAFKILRRAGAVPYMPQWSVVAELVEECDYEDWLAYDFELITWHCDGLVRLEGESAGADREWELATELNLPRFDWRYTSGRIATEQWITHWIEEHGHAATSPR